MVSALQMAAWAAKKHARGSSEKSNGKALIPFVFWARKFLRRLCGNNLFLLTRSRVSFWFVDRLIRLHVKICVRVLIVIIWKSLEWPLFLRLTMWPFVPHLKFQGSSHKFSDYTDTSTSYEGISSMIALFDILTILLHRCLLLLFLTVPLRS